MSFEAAVHAQAIELNRLSLEMCAKSGSGHPTTAMSLGHIVTVLMFDAMRYSPDYPDFPTSDRLVLSEGHAVPIIYAAAATLGMAVDEDGHRRKLTLADLDTLRMGDSVLEGHPSPAEGFPFFDVATGSLGMGLSAAAGIAKAAKLDGLDRRVYCIIGDGESREGQVAEALDFIMDHKLNNVLPIFNCNGFGQADRVSEQQSAERIAAKLVAAGFEVDTIDGHAPDQIKAAIEAFAAASGDEKAAPRAVVAKTVKGWGCDGLQGSGWHGKPAKGEALERALEDLDQRRVELTSALAGTDAFTIEPPVDGTEKAVPSFEIPTLEEAMKQLDQESLFHAGKLATRKAYGVALRMLGHAADDIVVLDADVSNSTFAETFAKDEALASRFVECKIGEQNMISVAAGMSAAGKIPFCSSFAKFLTRAYDQIEMAVNGGANIKIVGSHAGVTLAADGPSQMSLPDVAWFRALSTMTTQAGNPGCYLLEPADAFAAYALTAAMAEYEGVVYMRTHRPEAEFLYSDDQVFNLGGFEVLNKGRDIVLAARGSMVHEANKAVELLDEAGVAATLLDMYSIPFDTDKLMDLVSENGGYVISLEDNYGGGLGSAIADALAESGDGFTLEQMHVKRIPKSCRTADEALAMCGLTAKDIVAKVLSILEVA
ncbi:MAG: transketolase [Phycisphaerales bacterium]|jgi:transketolase